MKYRTVFDIIGPVMIGPSSSHTAGAARIGKVARTLFGQLPDHADLHFYGSFAKTYKGHGTDVAVIGGLLDYETDDERIRQAYEEAEKAKLTISIHEEGAIDHHPNTVRIKLYKGEETFELVGVSIGGGKIEIIELNGFVLRLSGNHPAILVVHQDRYGVIAAVSNLLAKHQLNIGHMEVSRKEKGEQALMVIEVDQNVDESILHPLENLPHITHVTKIHD
ncbi:MULTISPECIES: L-serine ammonia-lyase, iron-sulfur-dependent subunit beta [Shouchella]|uniref:L-serine deaminase n=3 Tax=Bacillaceae TaxID=186817 RepID=A0A060M2V2_9BACI|nr:MULTISPECIES: L-serine ammonia-lyase, iron-sulfur-dependent subunit beta [Bacillaceae]RQW20714.1 L-serine ammonia-lyase, iron-sulfur-dependent, subunit beta [Bacillus sp. C1-1]AIC94873.1 L-serine dehydratase, beta chain [Shouchella lehensis G1]KQL58199.1 serine dehydratase [Alkalicoccobacillus plakortidis]MBG9784275.1 serine dehydratase [Shouchella lehensis]TES50736.1 L-serine ammonia-lyase, iron-sulfur-dependent, subunit beta [Shouchella lehensis]